MESSLAGSAKSALGSLTCKPAERRATFTYLSNDAISEDLKEALAMFDHDKTGQVTTSDLVAAAKAHQETYGQNKLMVKIVKALLVTLLFSLVCVFGLTIAAIEMSKETKVSGQKVLVTPTGESVQVANSDMYVGADGELVRRSAEGGADARRLGDAEDQLLSTTVPIQDVEASDSTGSDGEARRLGEVLIARNKLGDGPYAKCKQFLAAREASDGLCLAFKYEKVEKVLRKVSKTGVHSVKVKNLPTSEAFDFPSMIVQISTYKTSAEGLPAAAGKGEVDGQIFNFRLMCIKKNKDCFSVAWPQVSEKRRLSTVADGQELLGMAIMYSMCGKVEGMCEFLGVLSDRLGFESYAFVGELADGNWGCVDDADCPRIGKPHCVRGYCSPTPKISGTCGWLLHKPNMYCDNFRWGSQDLLGATVYGNSINAHGLENVGCIARVSADEAKYGIGNKLVNPGWNAGQGGREDCGEFMYTTTNEGVAGECTINGLPEDPCATPLEEGVGPSEASCTEVNCEFTVISVCKCMDPGLPCNARASTAGNSIYKHLPCCYESSDCPVGEYCNGGECSASPNDDSCRLANSGFCNHDCEYGDLQGDLARGDCLSRGTSCPLGTDCTDCGNCPIGSPTQGCSSRSDCSDGSYCYYNECSPSMCVRMDHEVWTDAPCGPYLAQPSEESCASVGCGWLGL